jgi:hypothetical protein
MTEMSWAEKTARLQQTSLDLQLMQMQEEINKLNAKVINLEEKVYFENEVIEPEVTN